MRRGTQIVQILVVRREAGGKHSEELAAIYLGEFDRAHYEGASGSRDPAKVLMQAPEATLELKGQAERIAPIDLSNRGDLRTVLDQVRGGLSA